MLDLQGHGGCPALLSDQRKGPGPHPTKINPYSDEKGHRLMLFKEVGVTRAEGSSQEEWQQAPCSSGQSTPREAEGALLGQTNLKTYYEQLILPCFLPSSLGDISRIHDKVGD